MGKFYEVLKRAEINYRDKDPDTGRAPVAVPTPRSMIKRDLPTVLHFELKSNETLVSGERSAPEPADCYETLRTNLLARSSVQNFKTILFSGTTHGNGASTTAINFATTLAHNRQCYVLLIEANLRTPGIHTSFRIKREPGLSDFITKGDNPLFHLKNVGPENLSVITAGSEHSSPVGLFESDRFETLLSFMRDLFDYIILDAPPVSGFSEARVLCKKVDGVVLVLEAGKTRKQVAARAKKEIEEAGGDILGVVLNKRKYYIPKWIYKML